MEERAAIESPFRLVLDLLAKDHDLLLLFFDSQGAVRDVAFVVVADPVADSSINFLQFFCDAHPRRVLLLSQVLGVLLLFLVLLLGHGVVRFRVAKDRTRRLTDSLTDQELGHCLLYWPSFLVGKVVSPYKIF